MLGRNSRRRSRTTTAAGDSARQGRLRLVTSVPFFALIAGASDTSILLDAEKARFDDGAAGGTSPLRAGTGSVAVRSGRPTGVCLAAEDDCERPLSFGRRSCGKSRIGLAAAMRFNFADWGDGVRYKVPTILLTDDAAAGAAETEVTLPTLGAFWSWRFTSDRDLS